MKIAIVETESFFSIQGENDTQDDIIDLLIWDEAKALIAWATLKEMASKGVILMDWINLRRCDCPPELDSKEEDWTMVAEWPEKEASNG